MDMAHTTDLYQASYLLLCGCELTSIECSIKDGAINCRMSFRGTKIKELVTSWYNKEVIMDIWDFRQAYTHIHAYIQQAKKCYGLAQSRGDHNEK